MAWAPLLVSCTWPHMEEPADQIRDQVRNQIPPCIAPTSPIAVQQQSGHLDKPLGPAGHAEPKRRLGSTAGSPQCALQQCLQVCISVLLRPWFKLPSYYILTWFLLAGPKLNLQVAECSIVFPFTHDTAEQLSQAMTQLLQTFSEKQKAERPKRWPMMEFRCQGGPWLCL